MGNVRKPWRGVEVYFSDCKVGKNGGQLVHTWAQVAEFNLFISHESGLLSQTP